MKRVMEISAKTQDEAQELAKRELRLDEKIVAAEVLSAPTRGIFGIIGTPEVRVRFTIESAPPKISNDEFPGDDDQPPPKNRGGALEDSEAAPPAPPRGRRVASPPKTPVLDPEEAPRIPYEARIPLKPGPILGAHPKHNDVIALMKLVSSTLGVSDLILSEKEADGAWIIEANGQNIIGFIGKHGRTLDSLQYVLNIVVNKGRDDRVKLLLDAEGYRDQRYKSLIVLANRLLRKALDSGQQVELEPMSTMDRRTIHLALKDKTGIETFSRGIEPMRRVIISPKRPSQPASRRGPREPRDNGEPRQPAPKNRSVPMFLGDDFNDES